MKRTTSIVLLLSVACSNGKKAEAPERNVERQDTVITKAISKPMQPPPSNTSPPSQVSILSEQKVLEKVEILVPRSFKIMDAEMIAVKYPLKQRSAFQVYTDDDAAVNIAFEHTPTKATLKDLPAIKQVFEQQFSQPQIDFRRSEIKQINSRDFIVIEMITPAMDTEVYNLMFVTSLEDKLLVGTFNCTVEKMKEWQPIAEQILGSVKVKD